MDYVAEILASQDPELAKAVELEKQRQFDKIELIASENYVSPAVMAAQGSVLTNKYAEGYPESAITAAASMWISRKTWPGTGPKKSSARIMPMYSLIPAPRPILRCISPS